MGIKLDNLDEQVIILRTPEPVVADDHVDSDYAHFDHFVKNIHAECGVVGATGTTALDIPIHELPALAELAGLVVAQRSGLCELLSYSSTRLIVVSRRTPIQPYPGATMQGDLALNGWPAPAGRFRYSPGEPLEAFAARVAKQCETPGSQAILGA